MYDLVLSCREPRYDRRSRRSTVEKYLPPVRYVVSHLYLCHECGEDMQSFMQTYEGGI